MRGLQKVEKEVLAKAAIWPVRAGKRNAEAVKWMCKHKLLSCEMSYQSTQRRTAWEYKITAAGRAALADI